MNDLKDNEAFLFLYRFDLTENFNIKSINLSLTVTFYIWPNHYPNPTTIPDDPMNPVNQQNIPNILTYPVVPLIPQRTKLITNKNQTSPDKFTIKKILFIKLYDKNKA